MRRANFRTSQSPVFVIHTSGTETLIWKTVETNTYGELDDKVYNDWDGVGEITSLPDFAAHRDVDKIFLDGSKDYSAVKVAIVCPPSIYDVARGLSNKHCKQLYDLSAIILSSGKGMRVGKYDSI